MRDIKDANVAVYIPMEYHKAIHRTTEILAKKFGGTTNINAQGTWMDAEGNLVKEGVTIIRAWYAKTQYLLTSAFIIDLAVKLREECKQVCIMIEVEGVALLV